MSSTITTQKPVMILNIVSIEREVGTQRLERQISRLMIDSQRVITDYCKISKVHSMRIEQNKQCHLVSESIMTTSLYRDLNGDETTRTYPCCLRTVYSSLSHQIVTLTPLRILDCVSVESDKIVSTDSLTLRFSVLRLFQKTTFIQINILLCIYCGNYQYQI